MGFEPISTGYMSIAIANELPKLHMIRSVKAVLPKRSIKYIRMEDWSLGYAEPELSQFVTSL